MSTKDPTEFPRSSIKETLKSFRPLLLVWTALILTVVTAFLLDYLHFRSQIRRADQINIQDTQDEVREIMGKPVAEEHFRGRAIWAYGNPWLRMHPPLFDRRGFYVITGIRRYFPDTPYIVIEFDDEGRVRNLYIPD